MLAVLRVVLCSAAPDYLLCNRAFKLCWLDHNVYQWLHSDTHPLVDEHIRTSLRGFSAH